MRCCWSMRAARAARAWSKAATRRWRWWFQAGIRTCTWPGSRVTTERGPGGTGWWGAPWTMAAHGDPYAVPFRFAEVRPRAGRQRAAGAAAGVDAPELLFSFSGIKTGVLRYVQTHGLAAAAERRAAALSGREKPTLAEVLTLCDAETLGLIASFQRAVVENLIERTLLAAARYGAGTVLVSGGVAANRELRARFVERAQGLRVLFPSLALSTDNAAMIAAAAWPRLQAGLVATQALSAQPRLQLGGAGAGGPLG
jgi:N6-L-threonylcarbamoyladenine synthase